MTQRMLNMIQSAEDGIRVARDELTGPGAMRRCKAALQEHLFNEKLTGLSIGAAAYLACMMIYWSDNGKPPLDD